MELKIDCSTVIPSIEQTRDRLDISNPLNVSGGNPGLKAQRNINLNSAGSKATAGIL